MKSIEQIAMEFWCEIGQLEDLEKWVEFELANNPSPPSRVYEVFGVKSEKAGEYALEIAREKSGFTLESDKAVELAKAILNDYCRKLIDREIFPYQFCNLIIHLDRKYSYFSKVPERSADYPFWLGDLWNACDWCDESWSNENAPHLIKEVQKVMQENGWGYKEYRKF